jgi:hypothetical protein
VYSSSALFSSAGSSPIGSVWKVKLRCKPMIPRTLANRRRFQHPVRRSPPLADRAGSACRAPRSSAPCRACQNQMPRTRNSNQRFRTCIASNGKWPCHQKSLPVAAVRHKPRRTSWFPSVRPRQVGASRLGHAQRLGPRQRFRLGFRSASAPIPPDLWRGDKFLRRRHGTHLSNCLVEQRIDSRMMRTSGAPRRRAS